MIFSKHNGYSPDGRRLCHKGGDGGSKAMQRQEEERQARVNAAIKAINEIFDPPSYQQGVNVATEYDPYKTYYNKDGSVFKGGGAADGSLAHGVKDATVYGLDMNKVNQAIANGELFTDVQTVQPENRREKLYGEQRQAVYDINARDVKRQYGDAEKANRFGLARNGLMGGSADVDSNARLQEMTNEGLIKAGGIADNASAALKSADESARQSLISMAQSGIDTGSAQQLAQNQLDYSSQKALGERSGASIGNLFGGLAQAYLRGNANPNTTQSVWNGNGYTGGNSVRKTYGGD